MCGRCMKTCPWNLEGLFAEKPFRWAASNIPAAAPVLSKLDDALGNGGLNQVKKWWWDIELAEDGAYHAANQPANARDLQKDLELNYEDQTLAVYPANLAPPPWPYPYQMDREAGIRAYQSMISANDYKNRRAAGETGDWDHQYNLERDNPVLECVITSVEVLAPDTSLFTLALSDGADFPEWQAGAHVDVVISPDKMRQYSLVSDPAVRKTIQFAVLREAGGRGGSQLLHRIFTQGRRVFISRPINHFPLAAGAAYNYLVGGGIGITPMIAMAHELHAQGAPFELRYSAKTSELAAFGSYLETVDWADRVTVHISEKGERLDLGALFAGHKQGSHVYTCGPDAYMEAVTAAARASGFPEDAVHQEFFVVPDQPERECYPFKLVLRNGRTLDVAATQSAADVLQAAGIPIDIKCSDGLCGVCKCGVISGEVDHRDFVLSANQRKTEMITCQSRAAVADGVIEVDLG